MPWWEQVTDVWNWYSRNREDLKPIGALLGGGAIAWAALRQAGIASRRHHAQTDADRQRRITESFSKAVEQLGREKIETRLGGIYTLEQVSRESVAEYWTAIETMSAFVRVHARWKNQNTMLSETTARFPQEERSEYAQDSDYKLPIDIAAVLAVIIRRDDKAREREKAEGWRLNLRGSDLRLASLEGAHLERAFLSRAHFEWVKVEGRNVSTNLSKAHLEEAILKEAHLEGADLTDAHLQRAWLGGADLGGAVLKGANLEEAFLVGAHLKGAWFRGAYLKGALLGGADLEGARLEGADLSETKGLTQDQLATAQGDAKTILPEGLGRPADWLYGADRGTSRYDSGGDPE